MISRIKSALLIVLPIAGQICAAALPTQPLASPTGATNNLRSWIDPATGHRVVNLSHGLRNGLGFYFHQQPFIDASNMLFKASAGRGQFLFQTTVPDGAPIQLSDRDTAYYEVVGQRRQEVFYFSRPDTNRGAIYAMNLHSRKHRLITDRLPFDNLYGVNLSINANETLLATAYADDLGKHFNQYTREQRWDAFARLALTNHILTIGIDNGVIRDIHTTNAWLGHVQFSPHDPNLIEFCRESSAATDPVKDRMWFIRADGTGLKRLYPQTLGREIVTHEFWDTQQPVVWFELTLRTNAFNQRFFIAGVDVKTGSVKRFLIPDEAQSIHYNISRDGSMFCGDGGFHSMVEKDKGRPQWIWLFRRDGDRLKPERLFNMQKQDYRLEPNVHFDPTGKWVIFTYNGDGNRQVLAVEINAAVRPDSKTSSSP